MEISAKILKAFFTFASQDPARTKLYGIWSDGANLYATDGASCARYATGEALHEKRLISAPLIKNVLALTGDSVLIATGNDIGTTLTRGGHTLSETTIKASAPPFDKAIPRGSEGLKSAPLGLDAVYLARLEKLQKAAGAACVQLTIATGPLDPVRFDIVTKTANITVVIMPVVL